MISKNPITLQILILKTSHFCARSVTKGRGKGGGGGLADWLRPMFNMSTENGNDIMMVVQFCFSLSHTCNFLENFKGNGLKKVTMTAIFHSL